MSITLDTHITIPADVYTQDIGNESVLLDTQGGRYFGLDPVGTRMWQLLRQHEAMRPAYETMLREFEVTPERLETDLFALTEKMIDKGLAQIQTDTE